MMIQYKGTYCPTRQYMPQKLASKMELYLANFQSKYMLDFEVYCRKDHVLQGGIIIPRVGVHDKARQVGDCKKHFTFFDQKHSFSS